jgi:hypothetical protein
MGVFGSTRCSHFLEHGQRQIDEIGHALDQYAAGTSLNAGVKGLGKELRAGFRRDAAGKRQAIRPQAHVAEEKHCRLAASQDARRGVHHPGGDSGAGRDGRYGRHTIALVPRLIRGQDQRGDLTGRCPRGCDCCCAIGGQAVCICRRPHPTRYRPCQSLDIGGERRVICAVMGSMVTQ